MQHDYQAHRLALKVLAEAGGGGGAPEKLKERFLRAAEAHAETRLLNSPETRKLRHVQSGDFLCEVVGKGCFLLVVYVLIASIFQFGTIYPESTSFLIFLWGCCVAIFVGTCYASWVVLSGRLVRDALREHAAARQRILEETRAEIKETLTP